MTGRFKCQQTQTQQSQAREAMFELNPRGGWRLLAVAIFLVK
jgi:hypothetical protein